LLNILADARPGQLTAAIDLAATQVSNPSYLASYPTLRASFLEQLGVLTTMCGNADLAEVMLREAFKIRLSQGGPGDWETLRSQSRLGRALAARGRVDESSQVLSDALQVAESSLGTDSPMSVELLNNAALTRWAAADTEGGIRLLEKAIARERRSADASPRLGVLLNNLGALLWDARDVELADEAFEESLRLLPVGGVIQSVASELEGFSRAVFSKWGRPDTASQTLLEEAGVVAGYPSEWELLRGCQVRAACEVRRAYRDLMFARADSAGRPASDEMVEPIQVDRSEVVQDAIGEVWEEYSSGVQVPDAPGFLEFLTRHRDSRVSAVYADTHRGLQQIGAYVDRIDGLGMNSFSASLSKAKLLGTLRPPAMDEMSLVQLARACNTPSAFDRRTLEMVLKREASAADYEEALERAKIAAEVFPWSGDCILTYGIALDRCGRSTDALAVLVRADTIIARRLDGGSAVNVAFLAIAADHCGKMGLSVQYTNRLFRMLPIGWFSTDPRSAASGTDRLVENNQLRYVVEELEKTLAR